MGYFTLNDRIDEVPPSADTFHGGFGLFTKNHIPKSACRAMELLGQMGDRLLCRGEGYYITRSEEEIQIFLYNYSHYDLLYRYRHVVNMSKTKRYNVFVSKETQAFYIRLENMKNGSYQVRRYSITREGGSSYDAWVKMVSSVILYDAVFVRLFGDDFTGKYCAGHSNRRYFRGLKEPRTCLYMALNHYPSWVSSTALRTVSASMILLP